MPVIFIYSRDNKMLIAALAIEGMVAAETDDAILVCPKDRVQEVKKCVEKIRETKGGSGCKGGMG